MYEQDAPEDVDDRRGDLSDHGSRRVLQTCQKAPAQIELADEEHAWNHRFDVRVGIAGNEGILAQ